MKEQCLGDRRVLTQFALLELDFLTFETQLFFWRGGNFRSLLEGLKTYFKCSKNGRKQYFLLSVIIGMYM